MNIKIMFFTLLVFCGCNLDNRNILMMHSQGLTGENLDLNDMLFYDGNTGFIVGSSDEVTHNLNENSDTFAFLKRKALLYKTIDGGKTWIERSFGEGSFMSITSIDKKIFLIKVSEESIQSTVYASDDLGKTWKEGFTFPNVITDLLSIKDGFYIVAKDHDGIFRIFEKKNSDWITIQTPVPIYSICIKNGLLYYLSTNDNQFYKKNLLVRYDPQNKMSKIFELPKGFDCYFLSSRGGDIRLVGLKGNHIECLELRDGQYIQTKYFYQNETRLFPQGYYVSGNTEWIVVGRKESFGVSNKILKTTKSGKSWELIEFQKDKLVKPFYFLDENNKVKAWFYSGLGEFQVLE